MQTTENAPLTQPGPLPTRVALQLKRGPLDPFFTPRSVAVIGASERPGSVGRAVLENLTGFSGQLYAVNPNHARVLSHDTFPTIAAAPPKIDLAVIATPAATVPRIIDECVRAHVPAAIILSAGFKECGPSGAELEQQVAKAAQGKIRIVGPNCLGVMTPRIGFNATFARVTARAGNVAFLSQSGALCAAILDWSLREQVGFSGFVSVGSMLDVGWGELIDHFGADPRTHSILIYMESVGDARAFLSAAREAALTKPIVVIKVGRTPAGAKAAASHTGALTGSDAVLDAAFARAGVLRVDTIEELFDMAEVLAKQPRPRGPRLAIVTNAGGPGALAVDALVAKGGGLAPLSAETLGELNKFLPHQWSGGNPIDILGDADATRFARSVSLVAADKTTDGVLVILTPQAMTNATAIAAEFKASPALCPDKPIFASWMGGAAIDDGVEILNTLGIPNFPHPDRAARAFDYLWRYSSNLRALYETPMAASTENVRRQEVEKIITSARRAARDFLTEYESKQILAQYGIPTVETRVAWTEHEAVTQARQIGYPVAVKLFSETITHKAAAGGVQLDVRDDQGVRDAWSAIKQAVTAHAGAQHFLGVTVQRMAVRGGYELIVGSSTDPQFGPVLLFGLGGSLVEIINDGALGLPPLNTTLARLLIERSRFHRALASGARGPAVSQPALEQLLVQFSQLVTEQRWIKEIEINPLLASSAGLLALDARIVLHGAALTEEQLPQLAIRPYPNEYVTPCELKDGTPVVLRPIRAEDELLMVALHEALSERSVYYRYFATLSLDHRVTHERLSRLCFVDYDRDIALVADHVSASGGRHEILGVGRLCKSPRMNEAEFAVVVRDAWQRRGLGTQLLSALVNVARRERLARIWAVMLPDNSDMQNLCLRLGFHLRDSGYGECIAEKMLTSPPAERRKHRP